jgi:hypothetical protein
MDWHAAVAPETWPLWSLTAVAFAALAAGIRLTGLMRRQLLEITSPQPYLDGIRFTGLVAGTRPVFFARIGNSGSTDARSVKVAISAVYQGGGGKAGTPQTMTIPAHESREFFVRWPSALTTAVRDDILAGTSKLSVKIAVEPENAEPRRYCYQYYNWDNARPSGAPDFVPCDLDTQLGFGSGRSSRTADDDIPVEPRSAEYAPS